MYTDASAYTIVDISKSGCVVTLQLDKAEMKKEWKPDFEPGGFFGHTRNNDSQEYTYERNENGPKLQISKRKNGAWRVVGQNTKSGNRVTLGLRRKFHDFNF